MSRPMNVRERNEEAGSNADMRTSRKGTGCATKAYCIVPPNLAKAVAWAIHFRGATLDIDRLSPQTHKGRLHDAGSNVSF
jgi:hypothetical protein